jgi:RNA polymerase sigma-70 factor (ECF subfamily)
MDVSVDIRELLVAARNGAPDAVGRIFEAARGHLMQIAAQELPPDLRAKIGPSDLVQETAVDMHRDFAQFNGTTAEECFAWLRGILRHNAVDAVRHYRDSLKRNSALEVEIDGAPRAEGAAFIAAARSPDGSAIRREEAAALNDVMARLPEDYRRVLQLRYWSGMTFVDIAPLLGRSPDAVRKLWYRAVERLQSELHAADRPSDMAQPQPTPRP